MVSQNLTMRGWERNTPKWTGWMEARWMSLSFCMAKHLSFLIFLGIWVNPLALLKMLLKSERPSTFRNVQCFERDLEQAEAAWATFGGYQSRSSSLSTEFLFTPEVEHVQFVQLARRLRTFLVWLHTWSIACASRSHFTFHCVRSDDRLLLDLKLHFDASTWLFQPLDFGHARHVQECLWPIA